GYLLAMVAQPRYAAPDEHKGQAETAPSRSHEPGDGGRTEIATELSPVAFVGWQTEDPHVPHAQDPAAGDAIHPGEEPGADQHGDEHREGGHDGGHAEHPHHGPTPTIPLWLCAPFALLLLSIAVMPFINEKFWHHHFPDFAFVLGGLVASYYWFAFSEPG